jgi:hypothetical protein
MASEQAAASGMTCLMMVARLGRASTAIWVRGSAVRVVTGLHLRRIGS